MVSRIDLGPDGGPYVEIDEDAGDLVIRTPNNNVDFNDEALLNIASVAVDSLTTNNDASINFSNDDLTNIGTASVTALEAESVSTERITIESTAANYALKNDISLTNDSFTAIDEWEQRFDPIGSMSNGENWSPDEEGTYLFDLTLVVDDIPDDGEVSVQDTFASLNPNQQFADWTANGNRTSCRLSFITDPEQFGVGDTASFDIRQRTGSTVDLDSTNQITNMDIIKLG